MMEKIKKEIEDILKDAGISGDIVLSSPPKPEMGDVAFGCFATAKEQGKNPAEVAKALAEKINSLDAGEALHLPAQAAGPYVNFFINPQWLAKELFEQAGETYGTHEIGKGKKVLVEFGCPNPLKVFHLGHLKNLITGESISRILENDGYDVVRVNYQGDVGMHIAKAMWAMQQRESDVAAVNDAPLDERVKLLGQIYAEGAKGFENEESKKEIVEMNKRVYQKDPAIQDLYKTTVGWSLEYFDAIYKKLGTGFDRLYMESEVFDPGAALVREYLDKGVFKESEGAIIFEGSKHELHDRVFINSEGFPTYEGKDIGLAQAHFTDHNPDKVIHVVGKEQADYFKVVFKAIGEIWPDRAGKEVHVPGGFLQLKGEMKMSSRTGNVISGDELLERVEERIREIMASSDKATNDDEVVRKVTDAALTYAMLKVGVTQDVSFDMEESVSASGDSGPYLLYIVARIKSILQKAKGKRQQATDIPQDVHDSEKQILLALAEYPEITKKAAESYDPSFIAQYLFSLAQKFNTFYHDCPVLQAEGDTRAFRLRLIQAVEQVMINGLYLLGIEAVDQM